MSESISRDISAASPQQEEAAKNIRSAFLVKKLRYALLMAKCQSGKTGAFHALIREMLAAGDIQRAFVICGSFETRLRDQAKKDALKHNPEFFREDNTGVLQVYFHQDFKAVLDVTNALVIVDESHLVQNKGQGLHAFLGRHEITMDGNPVNLIAKNTYVLSVDATPYSEVAALLHKETPYEKHVEFLKPGDAYIGLDDYSITGRMMPTYDVARNRATFERLLETHAGKYALMRFTTGKTSTTAEGVVRAICIAKGYACRLYTSDETQIATTREEQVELPAGTPCLEDAPSVTTVVIIRGRLRAGKVVPKKHVGFVWEGAKNSKTDSLVQGLPGRMCGYDFGQAAGTRFRGTLPLIFVPPSALEDLKKKVIKDSEMDRAMSVHDPLTVLPRIGTNLKKGLVAAAPDRGLTACTPLRIEWDGHQMEDLAGNLSELKDEARELLRRNTVRISSSEHYSSEQKKEILNNLASTSVTLHGRLMDRTSTSAAVSFFKNIHTAYTNGTAQSEKVAECPEITYIITESGFPGLSIPGTSTRHVYVIFYTKAVGKENRSDINLISRIPKTTGKSIFSIDTSRFDRPIAAAGAIGIPMTDIKVPEKLEARLRDYLTLWRTSALVISRCISDELGEGKFRLSKRHYHYTSKDDNDVERMCVRLAAEFGIKKIDIKYARSGADMFNIKTITW